MSRSTAVTEILSGRCSAGGDGAGPIRRLRRPRIVERARHPLEREVARQAAADRVEPQQEARGHRRRAAVAPRAGDQHFGRAERAREIVRGKADPELQRRHAERRANLRRKPRIGRWKRRPNSFVEAAEDDQVGALQPRLEQPPDENPRMPAIRRPNRALIEQLPKQRHRVLGGDGQRARPTRDACSSASSSAAIRPSGPRQAASPASACRRLAEQRGEARQAAAARGAVRRARRLGRARRSTRASHPFRRTAHRDRRARQAAADRAARGRARGHARATAPRSSPSPPTSGCLSSASSGTGASSSAAADGDPEQQACRPRAATSGLPALSSASMPQRRSSADTRPASWRSGVTSAAVLPGVSSASRSASAIACASAAASGSSARRIPPSRRSARPQRLPFVRIIAAPPSHWRPRATAPAARPRGPTSASAALRRGRHRSGRAAASDGIADASLRRARSRRARAHPIPLRERLARATGPAARPSRPACARRARDQGRDGGRRGGNAGRDRESRRRLGPSIARQAREAGGCAARQGRSRPARAESRGQFS